MEAARSAALATIRREPQYRDLTLMLETTRGLELQRDAHFPRILKLNNESVGDVHGSPSAKGTAKYAPAGVSLWGLPLTDAGRGSRVAYSALNEALALRCLPTPVRSFFGLGNASAGSVDHDDRSAGGAAAHALSVDYRNGTPRNFSVSCEETVSFHIRGGVRVLLTGGEHSTAGVGATLESLAAFSLVVPIVVNLGAPFKEVRRNVLFADLRGRLGGVASWASTHGMNLPSHKAEVAADFALAGVLACTRMRRQWLLPMLEKGALGVPGSFDSSTGGKGKGLSDFGVLPSPYKSPHCPHDLGGMTMRGEPKREGGKTDGVIIGVQKISVNCSQCKGLPLTHGKNKGTPRKSSKTVKLAKELPAAKALYAVHGNSLFGEEAEEAGDGDDEDDGPLDDEADD